MKDDIEDLKLKIETYKELIGDTKKLKWEVKKLESEIIKKDNLIQGMKQINAVIFVELNGKLHAIRRMEVHENVHPIVGFPGHHGHRLVLKTQKASSLILPDKLAEDY